jgi:hypothetical protein
VFANQPLTCDLTFGLAAIALRQPLLHCDAPPGGTQGPKGPRCARQPIPQQILYKFQGMGHLLIYTRPHEVGRERMKWFGDRWTLFWEAYGRHRWPFTVAVLVCTASFLFDVTQALSCADGLSCAVVRSTSDGFVALRARPSASSKLIYKLKPYQIVVISVSDCAPNRYIDPWTQVECVPEAQGECDLGRVPITAQIAAPLFMFHLQGGADRARPGSALCWRAVTHHCWRLADTEIGSG